jgi:transcriptional antiterminator RfaH
MAKFKDIITMKQNNNWFVLYTKARQELKVLERLNQLGIETYAPTKIVVKRWSDRKKKIKTCLLPSMVLVRLPNNEVNKVFDVLGEKRYLFVHGVRAVVYDNEVIAMKKYLESKFEVDEQTKVGIGKTIDISILNQSGEIVAIEAKKCIVRLQMLGATMSFQLN